MIQNAGYEVTTTKEMDVALELAAKIDFDAVVICCSIRPILREQIARDLKRINPDLPLVIVCERTEHELLKPLAEAVILPPGTSQQPLLKAIGEAIEAKQARSKATASDLQKTG